MAHKPLDQLSPAYRKRIERALAKGKSRQQARGHKAQEHIARREKEREALGITGSELRTIRAWWRRNFQIGRIESGWPDEDTLVEYARESGYQSFKTYRQVWDEARRKYLRELKNGTYKTRGLGHLTDLQSQTDAPGIEWLYYH